MWKHVTEHNIQFIFKIKSIIILSTEHSFKSINLGAPGAILGYEKMVYLPLCEVADTPFHIHKDDLSAIL